MPFIRVTPAGGEGAGPHADVWLIASASDSAPSATSITSTPRILYRSFMDPPALAWRIRIVAALPRVSPELPDQKCTAGRGVRGIARPQNRVAPRQQSKRPARCTEMGASYYGLILSARTRSSGLTRGSAATILIL